MGKIFYVMGKSASGKDTIFRALLERLPSLRRIVSYTTRPARIGETDGVDYRFVDDRTIRKFEEEGRLIEKRIYQTSAGPWTYATVDDGCADLSGPGSWLAIGTLESYERVRGYFGAESLIPIYIEVEDGERLLRAIRREQQQEKPHYDEVCRRYLADEADFSEENLARAGIQKRYRNEDLEGCLAEITEDMLRYA